MKTSYYRVMLGRRSQYAAECFAEDFIGADFGVNVDLTRRLPDEWREFNREFIPIVMNADHEKSKIGAGLACGALWTIAKGIRKGDIVLCPDGSGSYLVGRVTGDYYYAEDEILPHRRRVEWLDESIHRSSLSDALRHALHGAVVNVTPYASEIEHLRQGGDETDVPSAAFSQLDVEDPESFALERHLEEFLTSNWTETLLGKDYDIYEEDGEVIGRHYHTDAGSIDLLAISHDRSRILVIELKRGRASDVVVGQTLRYMGFIREQLAEPGQTVEGAIIALEEDKKLKWALVAVPSIRFYHYKIDFQLLPG